MEVNNDTLRLKEPFVALFHNLKALESSIWNQDIDEGFEKDVEQARAHTKLILDYLRDDFGNTSRRLDDLESKAPSGLITYADLWLLYPPGTVVHTVQNGGFCR